MRRKNMGLRRDSVGFFFFVSFCKCNENDIIISLLLRMGLA